MNIFEQASRNKLRFRHNGLISVEDLWDLDITELDQMYRLLNKQLKDTTSNGLIEAEKSSSTDWLKLSLDIIKHIFNAKQAGAKALEEAALKAQRKQKLLEILASKQDAELLEKSPEEIAKMIDEL